MAQAAMDITQLLMQAFAGDPQAVQQLQAYEQQAFPAYLHALTTELANPEKAEDSRRLAGIQLKNLLDAKDDARRLEMHARWSQLPAELKAQIRQVLLSTLHSPLEHVRHTAAMAIAKVAGIDVPQKLWNDLIPTLLKNWEVQGASVGVKQATLEALGFVCEEIGAAGTLLDQKDTDMVLTAVVGHMLPTNPIELRITAMSALINAIDFAESNFEKEVERNYIMRAVCEGTVADEPQLRELSFQCLHEIAAQHYTQMPAYIESIYTVSLRAIQGDVEEVAAQAIEFWCTLAECEIELADEYGDGEEIGHHQFIEKVAPHLVPHLLGLLTKQDETMQQGETASNLAVSAGNAISLMARAAGKALVPIVMPFIHANIAQKTGPENWRLREAATYAFGSILIGPPAEALADAVLGGMNFLLDALKDPHPYVRDTTAWTIGRVFEFLKLHPTQAKVLLTKDTMPLIMHALLESLSPASANPPHIMYRVCDAIRQLAEVFKTSVDSSNSSKPSLPQTTQLSPFFKQIIIQLYQVASSAHSSANLQVAAFEAINCMVAATAMDTMEVSHGLIRYILDEITKTFNMPVTAAEQHERKSRMQENLCGVLQEIMHKLSELDDWKHQVLTHAQEIMTVLLQILSTKSESGVSEGAMRAVGTFTYACGEQFAAFLESFMPFLRIGLTNHQAWQVCLASVGVLGDICRNVGLAIKPYCAELTGIVINNLSSPQVHREVKPPLLTVLGDIAMAMEGEFVPYLPHTNAMLQQAMQLSRQQQQAASEDEEFMDYNNRLRIAILEAYSSIFQGLGKAAEPLGASAISSIMEFLCAIGTEEIPHDEVVKCAVDVLADMITCMGSSASMAIANFPSAEWRKLVDNAVQDEYMAMRCSWALTLLQDSVGNVYKNWAGN